MRLALGFCQEALPGPRHGGDDDRGDGYRRGDGRRGDGRRGDERRLAEYALLFRSTCLM